MQIIYRLYDPRDESQTRYVGKTYKTAAERLSEHVYEAIGGSQTYRAKWIRSLLREDVDPCIEVVEETDDASVNDLERQWIAKMRAAGHRLTNGTDGGEGILGYKFTDEQKQKVGDAVRLRWQDPQYRERLSRVHSERPRRPWTEEEKRHQSEVQKGRPPYREWTDEQRAAVKATNHTTWADPDMKERHAARCKEICAELGPCPECGKEFEWPAVRARHIKRCVPEIS